MAEQDVKNETLQEEEAAATETAAAEKPEKKEKKERKSRSGDLEKKLAAAEAQKDEAEQKAGELNERLLRTAAEYDNFRRRSQREMDATFSNAVCHAVTELLPVLDTLEAAAKAESQDEEYKKGVVLTLDKAREVFGKLGICEIEAERQPFDPELHNAVMQQPAEGCECGTVTQVVQKGYKMGDKVIRHAMVAVAP